MSRKRERRGGGESGFQAGPGTIVRFSYELFDAEGECVERSAEDSPLELLLGYGIAPAALETALAGRAVGAERDVVLPEAEAFGPRDPEAVIEVARSELPEDIAEGDEFEADREGEDGPVVLKVLEVREDAVVLDTNHPLAGQDVRLRVKLVGVRPATAAEIEAAEAALLAGEEGLEAEAGAGSPLLPVERLLKRGRDGGPRAEGDPPNPKPPPKRLA
ncbi:MAG TPA: FKBP-type peptidyl-prolyl cis-trans isomerase [Polyangiaceae bacterium]|nr:FKBP-type peptidyl-prolyl cis-trans isomerase [Polyangiaceae bacterium]